MKNTLEKIVSETILEQPHQIKVGNLTINCEVLSVRALIEVSAFISQLPDIGITDKTNVITEVLSIAKDSDYIGDIAAIMILGGNELRQTIKVPKISLFGRVLLSETKTIDRQKELKEYLLDKLDSEQLHSLILKLLKGLKTDFFLSTIIFLEEVNLLKRTKEDKTIQSGQSSPELQKATDGQ